MSKELNILISSKEKIVSINSLYNVKIAYVGGRPKPVLYKSPKAQRFASEARAQLLNVKIDEETKEWLTNTKKFNLSIEFILGSGINRRDVSNCDKLVIDQVTAWLRDDVGIVDFDDSLLTDVQFRKSYIAKASNEYCCLRLTESTRNLNIVIEKPSKLWFNKLEDKFTFSPIPKRKLKSKNYIEKVENKDDSDTKIYIISKNDIISNPFLVSDIENDGIECMKNGFGFTLIFVNNKELENPVLKEFNNRIKNIGYSNFRIVPIDYNDENELVSNVNKTIETMISE